MNIPHQSITDIIRISNHFCAHGIQMTPEDVYTAIKSACDFFRIPIPNLIQDVTNHPNGQTMFVNWDRSRFDDDVLCINVKELVGLKVDSKDTFSLVLTHEATHIACQNTRFHGINNGIWEQELAADFFMGCRAGLWNMNDSKLCIGLILTPASPTHPEGAIRNMFYRFGKYKAIEMRDKSIPLTIQNLLNAFMEYCQQNVNEILHYQRKFYRF